ncbi:ABC-type dipeptide/oligopeptide/nickel transport system permease subunit [Bradyrhizobium elkanii]|nr:ABC-type dipeptide/oligopeptide/nickel transport system permease subunit [Bradyrhizobium elkanii]MCP1750970.1 ABC-type dipeptide/oligopeptide/nickel transport system permease subunit [Bradyrhizobium elkanii]MCP1976744.1 ABC-type dipeptide/oligopeptide/nickel transport system permease subunit [Bradyrhizobium elkanii]MCS3523860.1 ABC-type dipeptide/oligopeptide/nickel transport system permease subunit [Bradyrhizobium elkanii]MCS3568702.1 ABC-type dipeptide/oligopeptide/nickel transport system 
MMSAAVSLMPAVLCFNLLGDGIRGHGDVD